MHGELTRVHSGSWSALAPVLAVLGLLEGCLGALGVGGGALADDDYETTRRAAAALRVNCGGPAYAGADGSWAADHGYVGGYPYEVTQPVAGTTDPSLYQSLHWNDGVLDYAFAVENGDYVVTLKFAEIYFASAGERVFDIWLNGNAVARDFDIVAVAGAAYRAVDRSFPVTVSDRRVAIHMVASVDNPQVNAIEIAPRHAAICPAPGTDAFTACYYRDRSFGDLALSRTDGVIDFDWSNGSPDGAVPADNFSARWEGDFTFAARSYDFTVTGDDGVRLSIDDEVLIDAWLDQPPTSYQATRSVSNGVHRVRLEYFEAFGGAVARLSWAAAACTPTCAGRTCGASDGCGGSCGSACDAGCVGHCGDGVQSCDEAGVDCGGASCGACGGGPACPGPATDAFTACYYDDPDLGSLVLSRTDAVIDFDWGGGSPDAAVPADTFSASWEGNFSFTSGSYDFTATGDDGVRLYLDGQLLIDAWVQQPPTKYTTTRALGAGVHRLRFEYFEAFGGAVARLSWNGSGCAPTCTGRSCGADDGCGGRCGSTCDAGCTAHCADGVQSCDENGVDCGGSACGICSSGTVRDIRSYGARCDGNSDDAGAVQSALDALGPGETLQIPCMAGIGAAGLWLTSRSSVTVTGTGSGTGLRALDSPSGEPFMLRLFDCTDCVIRGLEFQVQNKRGGAIRMVRDVRALIDGNRVSDVGEPGTGGVAAAVFATGGTDNTFSNNIIHGTRGIANDDGPRGLWVGNPDGGLEVRPRIIGNDISDTHHTAIAGHSDGALVRGNRVFDAGTGSAFGKAGGACNKLSLMSSSASPPLANSSTAIVEDNDFRFCSQGLQLEKVANLIVRNNRIVEMQDSGIYISGGGEHDIQIYGNTFTNAQAGGVAINSGSSISVHDNRFGHDPSLSTPSPIGVRLSPHYQEWTISGISIARNDFDSLSGQGVLISDAWNKGAQVDGVDIADNSFTRNGAGVLVGENVSGVLRNISVAGDNCFAANGTAVSDDRAAGNLGTRSQVGSCAAHHP